MNRVVWGPLFRWPGGWMLEYNQTLGSNKQAGRLGNQTWDSKSQVQILVRVEPSKHGNTSSTAQGSGGSVKNRRPIGEVGCCESEMAERSHWWIDRWLRSSLFLSLSLTIYLPTYRSICVSIYLSIHLSIFLFSCLFIFLSTYLSTYLSVCLSI